MSNEATIKATPDIHPNWLNIVRRMQSVAIGAKNNSNAIITIRVLIDKNGCPQLWMQPECRLIEPKRLSVEEVISLLTGE